MAKEFMCEKKIFLIEALSGNASFILQYTQTEKLLTDREYRNIHGLVQSQNQERIVIDLIDLLSQKGEDFCCGFLDLLKSPEIVKTMPKLRDMDWDTRSLAPSSTQTRSKTENWHTRTRDYCGYLYNVSAIKRGKKKQYFTAVLMEENESRTIMVFQTLLQERFVMAERKRTPVKLEKVVLQPNYKLSTKFTEISRFSILEDLPFKYNSGINVRVEDMSLNLAAHNVDKKNAETIKVNVTVEVIQRLQDSHCVTRAQKRLPMVKYLVGDMDGNQTTLATLVVWNHEHTVEEGKWYRVTNVSVGRSRNQITINTTPDSTLANVPSGGKCNVPPGMIDCQEFKGKIIGHLLSEEHTCPQGHPLERVNPCGRSVTCEKCPMTYISSSVKNIFRGNLSIQSDVDSLIREFHVEDRVIRKVLWEDLKSVKEVEDALVALPPVTITVLSGNVLSIAALTQDVATQKSAAHIAWTEGV